MSDNPYQAPLEDEAGKSYGGSSGMGTTLTLRYIHPLQAGKVLGILYFLLGLIFIPFVVFASFASGEATAAAAGIGMGVGMLLMYTVMGFIGGAIGAVIYNVVAKMVGGMRFDFE